MSQISLFREKTTYETFEHYLELLTKDVASKSNDYVLNVSKEEWLKHYIDRFAQDLLTVYPERITQALTSKGVRRVSGIRGEYQVETTRIEISLPYTGTSYLLYLRPSTYTLNSVKASISGANSRGGLITYIVELVEQDEQAFKSAKQGFIDYVVDNVPAINSEAETFNKRIVYTFDAAYNARKQKALSEHSFYERLGISINPDTQVIYQVPPFEKRRIPEPQVDKSGPKNYTQNPALDDDFYKDIIRIIYNTFKSVEKKPSIYKAKDEEELRDYILPMLETRYENSTVTGETFNKGGKTDILVRYKDNTNLFVAECKYWKGEVGFLETINQLFDRYLTWRDSKTALIFFVTNKEFSKVLSTIREAVKKHPYFLRENGSQGESSFSYIFHFPTDKGKHVYTEVMAFHFPG